MSASGGDPDLAWSAVDRFVCEALHVQDTTLTEAAEAARAAGLPDIAVSPAQGRLLNLLVRMSGARRVLEVGTLGGISAIHLARALPPDGRLVTLELDPHHAAAARDAIARAGLDDRVEVRVGRAADSLEALAEDAVAPFDLAFIDADKASYPRYLELVVPLMRSGGVVVADNVVRRGRILRPAGDPNAQGARDVIEAVGRHPRLHATVVQTVGEKGWDGLLIAVVD